MTASATPAGPVRLVPMTPAEYPSWAERSAQGFAAQQVASGTMAPAEAGDYAREQLALLLPDGLATPGHHLWTVRESEQRVGHLWIELRQRSDGLEAYVFDVELDEQARGRGLGRATMQLAQEQARSHRAVRMALNVFGHNRAAIRLYDSLGYRAVATMMTKRLPDDGGPAPVSGPDVVLDPMSVAEYARYRKDAERHYARSIEDSGTLPHAEALAKAADDFARLLPEGLATPGHAFWTARHDGEGVGMLWLHLTEASDGRHAFGYDFSVREEVRRRGFGRSIALAAERVCLERGVVSVGLNVFGFDEGARALYDERRFVVSAQLMKKPL